MTYSDTQLGAFHGLVQAYVVALQAAVAEVAAAGGGYRATIAALGQRDVMGKVQAKVQQDTPREMLEQIWAEFDFDQDGLLSEQENDALCRHYFRAMQNYIPRMLEYMVRSIFTSLAAEEEHQEAEARMLQAVQDKSQPVLDKFDPQQLANWTEVTRDMWHSMDVNLDGKVEKEEFISKFLDCTGCKFLDSSLYSIFLDAVRSVGAPVAADATVEMEEDQSLAPLPPSSPSTAVPPRPPAGPEEAELVAAAVREAQPMAVGDRWYLIEYHWWRRWCQYSGFDHLQPSANAFSDAIDNHSLLRDGHLASTMVENLHFVFAPRAAWKMLHGWYGGGPVVERRVIVEGIVARAMTKVEVHLVLVDVTFKGDSVRLELSRHSTVQELLDQAIAMLPPGVAEEVEGKRLAVVDSLGQVHSELTLPLQESGLAVRQKLRIEMENADGTFSHRAVILAPAPAYKRGFCGLTNLGNTCFMNSALQCLSNTAPLRGFFLSKQYQRDLNPDNPLGNGGELAESFAKLLHAMWSGEQASVSPSAFKLTLSRFAPQFSGYQQHDSQELIAFLLDGIHEDLNRVKKKEFVEAKDSDGRPDAEVAEEAWERHLRRNQSIVVDLFQGQLKSTLECPDCTHRSITFDPFMYLSVPIQLTSDQQRGVDVIFIPASDPLARTTKYRCQVPVSAPITKLHTVLAGMAGISASSMLLTDVWNSKVYKLYTEDVFVSEINATDNVVAFECPPLMGPAANATARRERWLRLSLKIHSEGSLAPHPLVLMVEKTVENQALYKQVAELIAPILAARPEEQAMDCDAAATSSATEEFEEDGITPVDLDTNGAEPLGGPPECEMEAELVPEPVPLTSPKRWPFTIRWDSSHYRYSGYEFPDNENTDLQSSYWSDSVIHMEVHLDGAVKWDAAWPCTEHSSVREVPPVSPTTMERGTMTLNKCMDLFTTREQLSEQDTVYCSRCKAHRQSFKQFGLWKLPPILVVHLKRFQYGRSAYSGSKLDHLVKFPIKHWDLSPWLIPGSPHLQDGSTIYELYAISHHSGSLHFGHYTAYCKHEGWALYNDSMVSPMAEESIQDNGAYILFYRRRDPAADTQNDAV